MAGSHGRRSTASNDRLINGLRLVALLLVITLGAALWQARRMPPTVTEMLLPVPGAATSATVGPARATLGDVREAPPEEPAKGDASTEQGARATGSARPSGTAVALADAPVGGTGAGPSINPPEVPATPPTVPVPLWTRKPDTTQPTTNGTGAGPPSSTPVAGNASGTGNGLGVDGLPSAPPGVMVSRPFAVPTDETAPGSAQSASGAGPEATARDSARLAGAGTARADAAGGPAGNGAGVPRASAGQTATVVATDATKMGQPAQIGTSSQERAGGNASASPEQVATIAPEPAKSPADIMREGVQAYQAGDYQKAYALWRPLAGRGVVRAQYHLGALYYEGRMGTPDRVEAYIWLNRSATGGFQAAEALRNKVFTEMSAAEKDQVRQRGAPQG